VSFLGLGQVFAAMQTGNVIFLGFGLGGAAGAPIVAPLVGLGPFLAGGTVAAIAGAGSAARRERGLGFAIVVEVSLLACAVVVAALVDVTTGQLSAYALIAMLSLAMGLRNTMARGTGAANLATTVLNLTLTAFTNHSPLSLASDRDLAERGAAILAILAGAATGAMLLKSSMALSIATAAAITLAAGFLHVRTPAARNSVS
jgi:uncharacterized membrane protein YoaK (UPF0700 family)